MNPLLIFIVSGLVVVIGYILSRPFENPPGYQVNAAQQDDLRDQYKVLLREIERLQNKADKSDLPQDLLSQIETKKHNAAAFSDKLHPIKVMKQIPERGISHDL